jgi:predicted dehydrogenase
MSPSLDEQPRDRRNATGSPGGFSRRDFIKGGIAAGVVAGGSLGAFYFGYDATLKSPLRVGIIGTGDQGGVLIGAINPNFLQVKSIADLRPYNKWRALHGDSYESAEGSRPGLMAKYGWANESIAKKNVKIYPTYEELIKEARADRLEAVIIALPLHLHAKAAIAAMKAGLHVFVEPTMARSVVECKEMALAAKQSRACLAVGYQRHYNLYYVNAVENISSGLVGEVHYIRGQYQRAGLFGREGWRPWLPGREALDQQLVEWTKKLAEADSAEIGLWSRRISQLNQQIAENNYGEISAEENGYQNQGENPALEELFHWRVWDRTGGGVMVELGNQQLDAANMFIAAARGGAPQIPLSVVAAGNRPLGHSIGDVNDHVFAILEYPAEGYDPSDSVIGKYRKIGVQYAALTGNGYGGYGETVYGTKATLALDREEELSTVKGGGAPSSIKTGKPGGAVLDTQASAALGPATTSKEKASRGYAEELEHWAWCVRHRSPENRPRSGPKEGLASAVIALTAKMSMRKEESIDFNKEWFEIDKPSTPEMDVMGVEDEPDLTKYDA